MSCDPPPRRRRFRVRASSTSDADFLASLTQLMQDRGGVLFSPPPYPRNASSLQRSLSSSPSRLDPREGSPFLARSRSPSGFPGSPSPPAARPAHAQDRSAAAQAHRAAGQCSRQRALSHEGKGGACAKASR